MADSPNRKTARPLPTLGGVEPVKEAVAGKVLLNCQAGCPTEQVVKELGLTMADLFPEKPQEVVYTYTDEDGALLFQAIKTADGKRYVRRPADPYAFSVDGEPVGAWENNVNGVRRVLFRLPQTIAAVKRGETIYVAEGEKDASNLVMLAGVAATCNPFGAGKRYDLKLWIGSGDVSAAYLPG